MIKNGQVSVYLVKGDAKHELASLDAGDFFGEGALLKGKSARRNAFVGATTYSLVYSLHVESMNGVRACTCAFASVCPGVCLFCCRLRDRVSP